MRLDRTVPRRHFTWGARKRVVTDRAGWPPYEGHSLPGVAHMSAPEQRSDREAGVGATALLLSVIVPAYNEGARIAATVAAIHAHLRGVGIGFELLVVDDGSTDDTATVLAALRGAEPGLRVIRHHENRGKGHAVRSGVAAARGRFIMFIDADLTIPIEIASEMVRALESGYDMAVASRWHPDSGYAVRPPLYRRVMGRVFRWYVRTLIVSDVRDTQCGCKAYRREVALDLFGRQRIEHFSFDAEVIFLASRAGYRIKEIPAILRHHDSSSIRPLRDMPIMLRDLARIRLNAARGLYRRPRDDWRA